MNDAPTVVAVRIALAAAGCTQEQVAEVIGLSQAAVSRRQGGQTEWTAAELHALASYLGVPVASLMTPPAFPAVTLDPARDLERFGWTPPQEPAEVTAAPCCDLHNEHCEPPSELCCQWCTEAHHPLHRNGSSCVLTAVRADTEHHAQAGGVTP